MRSFLCLAALSLIVMALPAAAQNAITPAEAESNKHNPAQLPTIEALRAGGNVIFFRHERTNMLRMDDPRIVMADCTTQRNLSVAGVANSQQTGEYIRYLNIPIGEVLSSPICRSMETARFAFGKVKPEPRLIGIRQEDGRTMQDAGRDLRALAVEHAQPGTNAVMIGHFSSAFMGFGIRLGEGDALVIGIGADKEPYVVGVIAAHGWGDVIYDERNLPKR